MNRFVTVVVVCAGCSDKFGEANHRFVLRDETRGQTVTLASGAAASSPIYVVRKFCIGDVLSDYDYPVCGEKCLSKLEGALLSGRKLP